MKSFEEGERCTLISTPRTSRTPSTPTQNTFHPLLLQNSLLCRAESRNTLGMPFDKNDRRLRSTGVLGDFHTALSMKMRQLAPVAATPHLRFFFSITVPPCSSRKRDLDLWLERKASRASLPMTVMAPAARTHPYRSVDRFMTDRWDRGTASVRPGDRVGGKMGDSHGWDGKEETQPWPKSIP